MSHSEICPVCNGKGKTFDNECTAPTKQCYGCYGKGWITIYEPVIKYPYIVDEEIESYRWDGTTRTRLGEMMSGGYVKGGTVWTEMIEIMNDGVYYKDL